MLRGAVRQPLTAMYHHNDAGKMLRTLTLCCFTAGISFTWGTFAHAVVARSVCATNINTHNQQAGIGIVTTDTWFGFIVGCAHKL